MLENRYKEDSKPMGHGLLLTGCSMEKYKYCKHTSTAPNPFTNAFDIYASLIMGGLTFVT